MGVVLTLDDARGHPDYKKFIAAFEKAEHKLRDYDRMCFLRWLAMANRGGGWIRLSNRLNFIGKSLLGRTQRKTRRRRSQTALCPIGQMQALNGNESRAFLSR